jgi:hypothetical protein
MKFTLTIPDPIFQGCQQLAREHDVRVATILNALIRRGIISCHVSPFALLHDEYLFKRQLKEQIKELERACDEWDGLCLEAMSGDEVAAIANGERSFSDSLPPDPMELLEDEMEWDELVAGLGDDDPLPLGNTTEEMIAHHLKKMAEIGALIDRKLAAGDDELESD